MSVVVYIMKLISGKVESSHFVDITSAAELIFIFSIRYPDIKANGMKEFA